MFLLKCTVLANNEEIKLAFHPKEWYEVFNSIHIFRFVFTLLYEAIYFSLHYTYRGS